MGPDDFALGQPAPQPFDFGSVITPPFVTPRGQAPQPTGQPQKHGVLGNPQDRMQAMKLAIMLPLALKAGPGAVQGLLQGFNAHEQAQYTRGRQQQADSFAMQQNQRAQASQDWQQQYQQGTLDNQRETQRRQFLNDFATRVGTLDDPASIDALSQLYGSQAQALGIDPAALKGYAQQAANPTKLQQRAAEKAVAKLRSEYGEKWLDVGAQFTHRLPGSDQPVSFDQLLSMAGQERDPNAPKTTPADKPDTRSLAVQAADASKRGDTAEYNRILKVIKETGQADDRARGGLFDSSATSGNSDVEAIADAITRGEQPPTTTGLYGKTAAVRAALAKRGYNLTTASLDYNATQAHFRTLNGAQQTRMRQAVDNASHSLDVIDTLAQQWQGGGFPLLNRGRLAAARSGVLGPQAQTLATQLEAQISDVTSELGNVYMGGNSPTDHALQLASKNLSADWSLPQLRDALKLARTNLQIRQNSIQNTGAITPSSQTAPVAPPPGGNPFRRNP